MSAATNLSIHPARATQRRLPPSIKTRSSSGYPLTPSRRGWPAPFAPRELPRFLATTKQCAPDRCLGTFGLVGSPLLPLPSRPGEFHPEPLTDPDLTLSRHPARATETKAAAFRRELELLLLPVGPLPTSVTCPLCSTGITPLHHYYGAVRP